jgi:hypothetical protein
MIDGKSLKYVITSLTSNEKHKLAHEVLDLFASKADCTADFDVLGEIALKAQHHALRLRCAIHTYTRATTSEQLFNARENLYTCYNTLNYPEKALFYIEQNLKVKPNDPDTLLNRAFNLALMGKRTEAEEIIQKVSTSDPKTAENIEFALSGKLLREGHTTKGINGFISSFKPKNHLFEDQLKLKFWDGSPQPGRTIVINGEGGIGDELINIRFMDKFKEWGMNPILYSSWSMYRPDTVDLFKRHGHTVVTTPYFFKKDYLWTHMMSIPGYLGLKEKDLWNGLYLKPLRNPKNNLKDKNKLRIGIKCSGNPYFEQDIYRSIPIDEMIDAIPKEFSIYFFDKEKEYPGTIPLKDKLNTWEDTLDYIDQMDVILTSCTSLPHAAGAIGKKTIVCVPIAKYYTWISTRTNETTPWYGDNFTVLDQTEVRSWKEPLQRANQILREMI